MADVARIRRLLAGTTTEDLEPDDEQAAAGAQRAIIEGYRRAHLRPPLNRLSAHALAELLAGRPLPKGR